jgi:hypothetical protein
MSGRDRRLAKFEVREARMLKALETYQHRLKEEQAALELVRQVEESVGVDLQVRLDYREACTRSDYARDEYRRACEEVL